MRKLIVPSVFCCAEHKVGEYKTNQQEKMKHKNLRGEIPLKHEARTYSTGKKQENSW